MKVFTFCWLVMLTIGVKSQNLVPNPSFEIFIQCPDNTTQIAFAIPWFAGMKDYYGNLSSSTDYYNSCNNSINGLYGVPNIMFGNQYAKTGNAFSGFVFWRGAQYREYLEVKLIHPLDSGKKYCVEFWVNNSGFEWAIDAIGLVFTNDSLITSNATPIIMFPSIENPSGNILSDTINWVPVSGNYIAKGGEQFITIGCFLDSSEVQHLAISNSNIPAAYYLVDDVSVVNCEPIIPTPDGSISVYPNPVADELTLEAKWNTLPITYDIYNAIGQLLYKGEMHEKQTLYTSSYAPGVYFIRFNYDGKLIYKKVVKE